MTFDVTSLLGVLPVTAREITRDETSISWRKVKLRLSVSRSNAPSPESVHEDLPDYEDAPETSSHANDRGGAEDDGEESEEEDELETDKVASDNESSNSLPTSPPQHTSALGLDFTSPIDLTQDDQQAHLLSQLAGIDLRDSSDGDGSSETRLREAEAFIASAVLHSHSLSPSPSPPSPPSPSQETLHENHELQSTRMTTRRVGRYETIYGLSDPDDSDDEPYFEISRPGITRWSSSPPSSVTKPTKTRRQPVHRELSLHPRLPSFLFVIPRYHRAYPTTWFKQNTRVKRVLDARKRRHASNPQAVPSPSFVKKTIERFGPSWRPRLTSVFDRVLKKTASDSAITADTQVSYSERMRTGNDIERPANVPRMVDPARLTMGTLSAEDNPKARLGMHPDATMVVPDEVPECFVVPSTPPPRPTPPPPQPPLPYLVSQANSGHAGGGDYPYIPTPPLDPIALPTPRLTREASLPTPWLTQEASLLTPRLTREASFASESTSNVPTPESGRVALPALPALGVPEIIGSKSVKYGSPSADNGAVYPYPYIATPPLPSTGLPPIVSPSLPLSSLPFPFPFTPLHPPAPIIPPTLTLPTLPTMTTAQPLPPLTTMLPSFPVGQPPPPLPPLQPPAPIIAPTLTLPTLPTITTAQPPPLTTVLPSFPVGQPPPPLPPLVPPLVPPLFPSLSLVPMSVPSLSVPVPPAMTGIGYMRPSPPPSQSSDFFRIPESQVITQPPPLSSVGPGSGLASHPRSASGSVPQHSLPPVRPTLSTTSTAPAPQLQLQTQLPPSDRITGPEPESMDCREDAYAPLIVMTSPIEVQPSIPIPEFVMGGTDGLYAVARPDPGDIKTGFLEAKNGEVTTHAVADGPSYQEAPGSGYASEKEGKGKHRATDGPEDGLDGDPPPFDESDPLWEELLAYRENPNGDGLGSSCVDAAGLGEVAASPLEPAELVGSLKGDPTDAFDLGSSNTSWDFSDVLDPANSNLLDQSKSEDAVWKELCAWADEQPPEMLESVFGMLDTSQSFVAEEPSVEPVGFGEFPFLDESQPLELMVPTIAVESAEASPLECPSRPQVTHHAIDFDEAETRHKFSSGLETSTSFSLDELDWDVMEEYAQLEDLECPHSSVDAARVMVVAIRAVAAKAKAGFVGTSDCKAFLPPSVCPSIVGVQSVSPSYEDAQVPLVDSHYHQPSLPFTSLSHVMAAS